SLVDGPGADMDLAEAVRRAREFKPDLLLVATTTPSISNDIKVAELVKAEAGNPYTVLVGTHVSARPLESLERATNVNAVTRREYDWTCLALAKVMAASPDPKRPREDELARILGITWRREDGRIETNPDRPDALDISPLPHAAEIYRRHLYSHWKRYFY